MSNYVIGDLQGCFNEFKFLLDKISFEAHKDKLWLCGDLVNRGDDSLACLKFIHSIRKSCHVVLGNHDLHLLAIAEGIKKTSPNAFVICITNPLDVIVMALQKYSGLPKNKVIGMAGILDSSRFIYFLSQELKVPVKKIKSLVLGGHGDSMVAMLNHTFVDGKK